MTESFDAVLADWCNIPMGELQRRLAAAHAAEVAKVAQDALAIDSELHNALARAEAAEQDARQTKALLLETTAVAITMLYDSHKADTLAEFSTAELGHIVEATAPLLAENVQVERIYRRAWDSALAAQQKDAADGG